MTETQREIETERERDKQRKRHEQTDRRHIYKQNNKRGTKKLWTK